MRALTKDELLAILAAAKAKSERDWLLILVSFAHGLRASEAVALTRDSIQDGFLDVSRLKGSNRTVQPLVVHENPLLNEHQALLAFIAKMAGKQRIFPITRQRFWQLMREHGRTAGVPAHKLRPHALKHTCALETIRLAGIENVRTWLGHRSMSSTGEYLKVSDADAAKAITTALRS